MSHVSEPSTVPAAENGEPVTVEILPSTFGGIGAQVIGADGNQLPGDENVDEEYKTSYEDLGKVMNGENQNLAVLRQDLRSEFQKPRKAVAREYRARHHPSDKNGNPLTMCGTHTGAYVRLGCGGGGAKSSGTVAVSEVDLEEESNAKENRRVKNRAKKSAVTYEKSEDLLSFGPGISSYFKGLKLMLVMYTVLLCMQLPVIMFNISAGDAFSALTIPIAATTIGNLYRPPSGNATLIEYYEVELPFCDGGVCRVDSGSLLFYYGCMDALTSLVFLIFAALGVHFAKRESTRFARSVLKVENYSIEVEGVPADCSTEEIKNHFESLVKGSVFDVQLVQATGNAISVCVERGKLIKKLARAEATKLFYEKRGASLNKLEKFQQKYDAIYEKVVEMDKKAGERASAGKALFAFVTFEHQRDRAKCLQLYRTFYFSLTCKQDPKLMLDGKTPLRVREAPPPSTLLWENNEVSSVSRLGRNLVSIGLMVILLCVTGFVNYLAEPYKVSKNLFESFQSSGDIDQICDGQFAGTNTFDEAAAIAQANPNYEFDNRPGVTLLDCLCENEVNPGGAEFNITGSSGLDAFSAGQPCADFLDNRLKNTGIQVAVSFLTLLVNTLIFFTLTETGFFMKYTSILKREMTIMRRLFIATYINTGLLVLLVNTDLEELFDITLRGVSVDFFGTGGYVDFSKDWYGAAGLEVMLIGFLNIFAPHMYPLLLAFINVMRRAVRLPVSQSDLNDIYLGPDFVLSYRYSQMLMMAYFIMTYSTGIPLLYGFGVISAAFTYWVDKYFFTKVCRTPAQFSASIAVWAYKTLRYAVVIHLMFGIWMLSSPYVFPLSSSESSLGILQEITDAAGITVDDIKDGLNVTDTVGVEFIADLGAQIQTRLLRDSSIPNLIVLALLFLISVLTYFEFFLHIINRVAGKFMTCFLSCLRGSGLRGIVDAYGDDRQLTYQQALDLGDIQGISSYSILDNPNYSRAFMQDKVSVKGQSLIDVLSARATEQGGLSSAFSTMGEAYSVVSGSSSKKS